MGAVARSDWIGYNRDMWREPETTDEYWYGVWDFMEHQLREAETVDVEWITDTTFFRYLITNYPDMLTETLTELGFSDLVEVAEISEARIYNKRSK